MGTGTRILIGCGSVAGFLVTLVFGGLLYVGIKGPAIEAVPGGQLTRSQMKVIEGHGLLEEGESIRFFYSDALVNIEEGMYFFTDRKVVVHRASAAEPRQLIPFEMIEDIRVQFDDSFFSDSQFNLQLRDGGFVLFPVSSEKGNDRLFQEALLEEWKKHGGVVPAEAELPVEILEGEDPDIGRRPGDEAEPVEARDGLPTE